MLGFLRRRPTLSADRRPALVPDERILAWAQDALQRVVVATNRGLWLPGSERFGWHQINKAAWSGRELRITPAEATDEHPGYTVVTDGAVLTYLLPEPGELPAEVRLRVTKSVAYTAYHPLPGGGGVRIAARRVSGVDGLTWTVRYNAGTATDSAAAREATAALVGQAQDATAPPD